jgi:hypothetical protein
MHAKEPEDDLSPGITRKRKEIAHSISMSSISAPIYTQYIRPESIESIMCCPSSFDRHIQLFESKRAGETRIYTLDLRSPSLRRPHKFDHQHFVRASSSSITMPAPLVPIRPLVPASLDRRRDLHLSYPSQRQRVSRMCKAILPLRCLSWSVPIVDRCTGWISIPWARLWMRV